MGVDGCHSRQRVRPKKRKCFQKGNPVIHMSIFPRRSLQGTAMWEPERTQDLDPAFGKSPLSEACGQVASAGLKDKVRSVP